MRINLLSSFAAGLLLSTAICGVVYFSEDHNGQNGAEKSTTQTKTVKVQASEAEMKDQLAAKGYVVQTKAEYDKNLEAAKKASQPEKTTDQAAQGTRLIINVTDGMTSIDVGRMLVQAKLVDNAFNFSKTIEQRGLENKLRPGIFTVDSGMSVDQIIATIFK